MTLTAQRAQGDANTDPGHNGNLPVILKKTGTTHKKRESRGFCQKGSARSAAGSSKQHCEGVAARAQAWAGP